VCVCVCVCVRARVCVCACARACVRARVCGPVDASRQGSLKHVNTHNTYDCDQGTRFDFQLFYLSSIFHHLHQPPHYVSDGGFGERLQ